VSRTRTQARGDRRVLPADPPRGVHPADRIVLDGRALEMRVGSRLTDAHRQPSIDGATILTLDLWDGDGAILRSDLLGKRVLEYTADVTLDGLNYTAAGLSKSADTLTASFESSVVARLKRHGKGKPVRVSRDRVTRAEFCAGLIRDAGEPVLVLDEDTVQPIAGAKQLRDELAKAKRDAAKGSRSKVNASWGSNQTVQGVRANQEQRRNIATAIGVAQGLHAPELATLALIVAMIQESWAKNLGYGDASSLGVLQLLASTAAGLHVDPRNVAAVCALFLNDGFWKYRPKGAIELARENPSWSPGAIAQACQGSAGSGSDYDRWDNEARGWLGAAQGVNLGTISIPGTAYLKTYYFDRRRAETTWQACRRLLDEVQWRLFEREGVVVIATDTALMRAQPSLTVNSHSEAVESIDFEWNRALSVNEMSITAFVGRYDADPGETVHVEDTDQTGGRWLLASADVPLFGQAQAGLTLRQPQVALPEPAPEIVTVAGQTFTGTNPANLSRSMTPKQVIDEIVLPIGRHYGLKCADGTDLTPGNVTANNARHGATTTGGRSDHQGPPNRAWAVDMSNGYDTPQEQDCAYALARIFGLAYHGSGLVDAHSHGFRFQLIHRTMTGGNHYNHVHFGVRRD
jgi:hypothetical protein